jgi:hypothetical protein
VSTPLLYIGGDPHHGVVRAAREIASAVTELTGAPRLAENLPPTGESAIHLHFTDRLFGSDPEASARRIVALARGRAVTLTLHDVPQASDGSDRLPRRTACYRAVIAASAGIVATSHHEAALLHASGVLASQAQAPHVIPLAITPASPAPSAAAPRDLAPEVALLGFIYPGKGHAEAIDAVAALAGSGAAHLSVQALGAPAAGHQSDLDALSARARRRGLEFTASGWLDETELACRARAAAVPLAAHTHLSASGSINTWIALGRRPLVVDSRYAREIDALRPGTIRIYAPAELTTAIAGALADPLTTWLTADTDTRPHLPDVARRYLDWWAAR